MSARKLVVATGWWSSREPNPWLIGDAVTRSPEFFGLWLHLVEKYVAPQTILVVDSHSPVKPPPALRDRVKWLELDRIPGHPNDIRTGINDGKFCGVSCVLLLGATYALCNNADTFAYLEQGVLLRGDGFLDKAIAGRDDAILMGEPTQNGRGLHGGVAAEMPQTSIVIVGRASLERFIASLATAPETDGELSPEVKVHRYCAPVEYHAVPFGRSRPIDLSRDAFYVKHATWDELAQFLAVERLDAARFGLEVEPRA